MSIFRIYVDGSLFYHPNLSKLAITHAQVSEDAESIDSFTLSAPYNHPYLDTIRPMASVIVCKKDEDVVFEGRALDEGSDFYNTHTWTCEYCLAYLKDTIQPPFSYKGPLRGLLEYFLRIHNEAVEEQKRFVLGNVTVRDDNDYISYSNSEYSVTMDTIKNKLLDTHGGYLQIRYTESGKVLDYLEDFNLRTLQTVEFGKNLLDVKITRDHTERATALIPLGAKKKTTDEEGNETESDERVDITSVNGGKNYICDENAVKEIGWIWTSEIWENVTLPGNLLRKAKTRLADLIKGVTSIELTIVDESDTGADIGDIRARMYVECISKPHGINGTYLVVSRTRDYLNPSGNTITIGASGVTLTSATAQQNRNIEALEDDLFGQTSKIESISGRIDDINAQKMYRTELVVDGVSIFRDKGQASTMRYRVYSWDKDITDTLSASAFVWHRRSGNSETDAQWDASHIGMKTITITTEDVQDNASFFCEVTL
ncbi:phage tail protein [Aerococcaceae bacterium NML190073]|nr:phage tail protein [Aerococcaceae bacterium NML190073]